MISRRLFFLIITILGIFGSIAFVFFKLPADHLVAGGDFYQLTNYTEQLSRYQYAWFHQIGQGSYNPLFIAYPYYLILAGINIFFNSAWISSWIIFLFLCGAFFSFWVCLRLIAPGMNQDKKIFASLLYALNTFILTIFTYSWGYTHHFLIYLAFPFLFASYISFLQSSKDQVQKYFIFGLCLVFSLPAYNNVSFLMVVGFVQAIVTFLLLVLKLVPLQKQTVFKLVAVAATYGLVCFSFFYPVVYNTLHSGSKYFHDQAALGGENYLSGWISSTSSNFLNTFSLALDNYRYPFFQSAFRPIFVLIGSFYLFLLILLLALNRKKLYKPSVHSRFTFVFLLGFTFISFLAVRFYEPLTPVLKPFYLSPFFIFFRSPEKLFIALPFFYTLSIAFLLETTRISRMWRLYGAVAILISLPFILGVTQQLLVADYNQFAGKKNPEYTYVVKVPEEYKQIQSLINENPKSTALVSVPYSVKNSINWANYPKWHFVGHDILHLLFNKRYISANSFDHPVAENKLSFKDWAEFPETSPPLLDTFKRFGTEYVILHKDIDPWWIFQSDKLSQELGKLTEQGEIIKREENDYFTLYQLNPQNVQPVLSSSQGESEFWQINPTLYRLKINTSEATEIQFLESFDEGWKIFEVNPQDSFDCEQSAEYLNGQVKECFVPENFLAPELRSVLFSSPTEVPHQPCFDFANCWSIDPKSKQSSSEQREFILYYQLQSLVYLQIGIVVTYTAVCLFGLWQIRRSHE